MGIWDDWRAESGTTSTPNPLSRVNEFKKEVLDKTAVGKVEQKVGAGIAGAIEKGQNSPFRFLVNPALNVMEKVGGAVSAVTQTVATPFLAAEASRQGKTQGFVQSFRFAREQAKKISMGQALATGVGQFAGSVLPDQITPTFMDKDFDVFDDKQRNQAYKNEFLGWIASGSTDLGLALLGSKGIGTATKAAKTTALGSEKIATKADQDLFKKNLEDAVAWGTRNDGTPPPTGLSKLVDDAVKTKDVSKIIANPLVSNGSNPNRSAAIMARIDNHRDMADYLLAERGDKLAFQRFFSKSPLMADHLDNYGMNNIDPISDLSKIHTEGLDPKLTPRYQQLIEDKKATDREFKYALESFKDDINVGQFSSYRPGKFASIESVKLAKEKIKLEAKFGDLKLFGKDGGNGWRTQVYQSSPYDRVIRTIAWVGSGRPQGMINISNPRKYESAMDVLSDLNRLQILRGQDGTDFKRKMVSRFLNAQDDTQRAIALDYIEQQVMLRLAKFAGAGDVQDIRTAADQVKLITSWHDAVKGRRQTIKEYATKNGFVPDENGGVNVSNFFSISNEASIIPMLDFRKLEIEVILNSKRVLGARSPITAGQVRGAVTSKGLMGTGEFLDLANATFSNLNLIRLAYIPKNSIIDPFARASMALGNLSLLKNAIPGVVNLVHNNSLRIDSAKRFIPGSPSNHARKVEKQAQKEMDILAGELKPVVEKWEAAQKTLDDAEKNLNAAVAAQAKAEAALRNSSKTNKADLTAAKNNADYQMFLAQRAFVDADDALTNSADMVNGVSSLMKKHRDTLTAAATHRAELQNYKYLGQDKEILEVGGKKYTIDGLADTNIRGASAYLAEMDTAANFINTQSQSQISRQLRADGTRFVTIKRNEVKPYMNALTHIANRQIRQELDLPLGMMFRGDSPIEIVRWLYKDTKGAEYRRRMESRAGKPMGQDDFLNWATATQDKLFKMYPDPNIREIILNRNVSIDEMTAALKNRPDLLPEIDGPNIDLSDLNSLERGLVKTQGAIDAAWRVLAAAENRMVRNPLFLTYVREEMKDLIAAAQRNGIDPSDAVVNNQFRQVAYRKATDRVERTLYSSRRLSNGMYAARFAMSFPLAFFNSQAVALRLMAKNPMNAYWYGTIANAFDNFESYEDEDGNTYKKASDAPAGTKLTVRYPIPYGDKLPKGIKDALKPFTDPRGGGVKFNPKQMEFMIADPSVSWFGGIALSELVKNGINAPGGLWKVYGEDISEALRNTFGDDFYENSLLYGGYPIEGKNAFFTTANAIMPSYLQSLIDAGKFPGFKSERFADDVNMMFRVQYSEWDRNGRVGNPPNMDSAAKAAANMAFIRSITQFSAPISVSFDPVTRAATQYYSNLVTEFNGDYDKAQDRFVQDFGVDGLAFIGSNRKNIAGVSANLSDIKMLRNNPELLESIGRYDTKFAQMLSTGYGDLTDEYSTEVAAIYKKLNFPGGYNSPLTQQKSAEEVRASVEARRGWYEYDKLSKWRDSMMYQYGIKSTSEARYETTGIQAEFNRIVANISDQFKGWADERQQGAKDFWNVTVPVVEEIVNNQKWMNHAGKQTNKWNEISFYLQQIKQWKKDYDLVMNDPRRERDLRRQLSQWHFDFLQVAGDDFDTFSARWFENMPQLNPDLAVR